MISHCKNGRVNSLHREAWYMTAVLLKLCAQILICLKLEAPHWSLPAKVVLAPFWLLLPALATDVFIHLIHQSRY
ncbi:Transmembrane protein 60 [Camponotus japonicus]